MNVLIFGDSISAGCWDQEGGWVNRLQKDAIAISTTSAFIQYDMIYNLSISGDKTDLLLQRFSQDLISRLTLLGEKIAIIFAIGLNDSIYSHSKKSFWTPVEHFKQNIDALLGIAEKYSKDIFILGLTPADESKVDPIPWVPDCSYKNEYIKIFNYAITEICTKKRVIFIPLYDLFIKQGHVQLLEDGIHPNTTGHNLIYETVNPVLLEKRIL